ncbi:hypothetical protein D2M30_4271 [Bacillus amyloliquefaciens]|uniref:hypothetical protein n=1 Tax=Bacillus amyloliquefaciens TaxID=1390 RepID=UPI000F6428A3|nr:hypothetical protein [Bacillus amyloliquefaciens]QBG58566.1 hypothetical protein D2M30_4271 [Bacillus amyloliquefaciens]
MKKLLIFLSLLTFIVIFLLLFNFKSEPTQSTQKNNTKDLTETTLVQAYKIGMNESLNYDPKAVLLHMNSIDDGRESGANGEKSTWQLLISLPSKNQRVGITVKNKRITQKEILRGNSTEYSNIKKEDIKIDSKTVVKKAIKDFSLEPGNKNNYLFKGFQFKLIKEKGILFLTVVGDKGDQRMEIHYDGKTGSYLGRTEG